MYNYYDYGSSYNPYSTITSLNVLLIVSSIIAVLGAIALMILFLAKRNETKFTGFLGWLYDFLNFKNLFAEKLLKGIYLVSTIFITIFSLGYLFFIDTGNNFGSKFLSFLLMLIIGNVVLRVVYEFMMLKLIICKNTTEINKKLGSQENKSNLTSDISYGSDVINNSENVQGVVYCPNCGNKHDASDQNCPYCGYKK